MSPRFSIVYPTRHRPEFVRQALLILETQGHDDFEVIVSDNYLDPALSCERICRESGLARLRYVRPPQPVGMVENWNHAFPFATADYVSFLTDKMFMLPGALTRLERAIGVAGEPEIVSWTSDAYNPARYPDYFGSGDYFTVAPELDSDSPFRAFQPNDELDRRGTAAVARFEQGASDYCRGKLVFGAYRRDLAGRIVRRFGALFHNINPDYTSMVLGLSEATHAIELASSCVVSVNTDLSNGMLSDTNDVVALAFLDSLEGGAKAILPRLLVPGLYASQHNWVAHDYLSLKQAFDLPFAFDPINWLAYCWEDIHRPTRQWSDPSVEADQKRLLEGYVESRGPSDAAAVRARLAARVAAAEERRAEEARRAEQAALPRPIHRRVAGRLRRVASRGGSARRLPPGPAPFASISAAVAARGAGG